ncbi:MAG: sensor histidine kinase, partial [Candidatus Omnitrophica bacterium]|nr:sensor histidine kinase [Candidatus Omnitrophota bacterium]
MGLLIQNVAQAIRSDGVARPLEMKPVGLMEIAWNSIRAHSIRAKDQGIELEMLADGKEEDFYILASKPLVERLLDNLISNAIKFTNPGGRVLVRLDNTEDSVLLSVEDTGIGIDENEIPNLFERFHKADRGEMDHAGGLGLGLSICKEIADSHGAQIEVESQKGKGSIFRVIWLDTNN